jgi:predicted nucleic acid-binding Zn ribbon protein
MPKKKNTPPPVDPDEAFYLSQIPKQITPKLEASKVANVLRQVIQRRGYAAIQSADQLRNAWEQIVGPQLAKQTQVGKIQRNQLLILASNKVVASELEFMKSQIVRQLQSQHPEFSIRSLKISVDGNR